MQLSRLAHSTFLRDAFSLSGGTAFAQGIAITTLPILTRLYSPEDFGKFALYMTVTSLLSIFASLRLEQVIMLPKSNHDAARILVALFVCCTGFALFVFITTVLCGSKILVMFGNITYEPWFYLLPISVFLMGSYEGLRFWQIRQKKFTIVSQAIVSSVIVGSLVSILIGIFGKAFFPGAAGLVIGFVVQGIINMLVLFQGIKKYRDLFKEITWKHLIKSIISYKKLLRTLFISRVIMVGCLHFPVMAIGGLFGNVTLGYYSMAMKIVTAPSTLVSKALGDVYRQRAAVSWNEKGRFDDIFRKTLIFTTSIGIPAYLVGIVIVPELFVFVLGEEWRSSGYFAQILLIAGMFQFISTPVDKGAVIVGAHKFILFWNILRLLGVIFSIGLVFVCDLNSWFIIWFFVINNVFSYLVNTRFEYIFSRGIHVHNK